MTFLSNIDRDLFNSLLLILENRTQVADFASYIECHGPKSDSVLLITIFSKGTIFQDQGLLFNLPDSSFFVKI